MIRQLTLLAVAASLIGASAPVAPAIPVTGVAYDQVSFVTDDRPIPQVGDFEKVWTADVAALRANPHPALIHGVAPMHVQSIAWLGTRERVVDPIDGSVTIFRPDDKYNIFIDTAKHTYRIVPGVSDIYSVGSLPTPAPGARQAQATLDTVVDKYPDVVVDGVPYAGIAGRVYQTVNDPHCGYAQDMDSFSMYADPKRLDPMAGTHFYSTAVSMAPMVLSALSGCSVTSPADVAAQAFAVYPDFVLYSADITLSSKQDMTTSPVPIGAPAVVMMRGHVRSLTQADAALFEPPAGYTKVR